MTTDSTMMISEEFSATLAHESEVRWEALVAAYDAARLTRAERRGASEARAALRGFEESSSRALARRRKALAARFGRCDLEYLARQRGSHPLVRDAIEATYRHHGITPAQIAAFGRMVNAERAIEGANEGPLASHAAALEEHFGTRNVFEASYDSLRYMRPGAI